MRGSIPSPISPNTIEEKITQAILGLPQNIETDNDQTVRDYVQSLSPLERGTAGGNTACVQIQAGEATFIVDAGSGIRELGWELMKGPCGRGEGVVHIFFSHAHWDHIQGFPFFTPAFVPGNKINFYSVHDIESALDGQQSPLTFPISLSYMQAKREFVTLKAGQPFSVGPLTIHTIENAHPGQAYSYRFEDQHSAFVYASDAEYKQLDDESIKPRLAFFKDADALLFDAQYTLQEAWQKVDWGHGSAMIGVDLARAAGVKNLLLFHYDPTYSDAELQKIQETALAYQAQDTSKPTCEVIMTYEGFELDLTPPGTVDMRLMSDNEATILMPTRIFDKRGVDQLATQLDSLTRQDILSTPIIDLSQVETLTTASLKSLIALRRKEDANAQIVLANPSASATEVIKLSGYLDFFAIYPSIESALDAIKTRESLNLSGQIVQNRYRIESEVGEGRLGAVLKATDTQTDQIVALKILSPMFSSETITRFMRRMQQIINLEHPNIVKVHQCDRTGDFTFEVEDFMPGPTLQDVLIENQEAFSADEAIDIAIDITLALEFAHSYGVVHGDLKPENVFLTEEGAKLSGFGLGRLEEGHNLLDSPLLFLTSAYLAPEQIMGQTIDARADLYALGVILYQLFTGKLPFRGTEQEVMQAHLNQDPRPPRELNPHISLSLEHLILKLLAKNPNDRYASAQQPRLISNSLIFSEKDSTAQRGINIIDRETELAILQKCWQNARRGQGQLAFITGELGIGKTSLAQEAAVQSEAPVLLIGRCQELEGSPPYHPFIEALQIYFRSVPPELFDHESRQLLANFADLVPRIRQALPDLPVSPPLEPKQEHLRLMTSLTQFIKQATRERPWFLILDNLQWADQSSLELLRYLGRHLPAMAMFVVGTYRDEEAEQNPLLRQTLQSLKRHPSYYHLPITRLTRDEVQLLLSKMWIQEAPPLLVEKIFQHTGGNPFYVEEVAKGLIDDGYVNLQKGTWHFPEVDELRLPENVRVAIWRRIRHLSPDTQTLLRSASILGQSFHFDVLQEMSGLSEREVLEHLDMALERQLIQETTREAMLRFSQTEIHYVLYADIGPLRRKVLHNLAGEALEKHAQPHPERIAEELAHHFSEANQLDKAIKYGILAAQQAQKAYANESALQWYNRTLAMMAQLDPQTALPSNLSRVLVHQSLAEVLTLMGWYDEALEHYDLARSYLQTKKIMSQQIGLLINLYRQTAQVHEKRNEYDIAFSWLNEGLNYVDEAAPTIEAAHIYLLGANLYYRLGNDAEAKAWCQKSLDITTKIDSIESSRIIGHTYCCLGAISSRRGTLESEVSYCRKGIRIFEEIGDAAGQSTAYSNIGSTWFELGDWQKTQQAFEKSLSIAQQIGDIYRQGVVINNLASIHLNRGAWAEVEEQLGQSIIIWKQIDIPWGEAVASSHMAQLNINRQQWAEAKAWLVQAQTLFAETGNLKGEVAELERRWSEFYLQTGEFAQAFAHINRSIELAIELNSPLQEGVSRRILGQIHLAQDDDSAADAELQQSINILSKLNSDYELAQTKIALTHLLAKHGETEKIQIYFDQAIETFEKLGAQFNLAEARIRQQQFQENQV